MEEWKKGMEYLKDLGCLRSILENHTGYESAVDLIDKVERIALDQMVYILTHNYEEYNRSMNKE